MKRNMRVIQISGLRGILTVVFVATCLAAGFIAFPAIVAMNTWNYVARYVTIPTINIYQGLLLWAIVAITGFIINDRNKYLVTFSPKKELNEEELQRVINNMRMQAQSKAMNSMMLKSQDVKHSEKTENAEDKDKENV